MDFLPASIPEVVRIKPRVFGDDRGHLYVSWERKVFAAAGLDCQFVQDNHSGSSRGVLRGLHYQIRQPQGKLVRVVEGEVYDVAVDLRRSSRSFGRWVGVRLSAANREMLWVPPGFAHGFLVLSAFAQVLYKCTDYYAPDQERSVLWNDPQLGIKWPLPEVGGQVILSAKDSSAALLGNAATFP